MRSNLILRTDSYKSSQWKQYPKGSEELFSYFESRGGVYPETVFFWSSVLFKGRALV
jgi:nicotinamide phosphoribosyltransferase